MNILGLFRQNKNRDLRFAKIIVFGFIFVFLISPSEYISVNAKSREELFVTFMDVGQGDSSLISTSSGFDILIDVGPTSAGESILPFLGSQGIDILEVVVLSHNDSDHIGGLVDVLQSNIQVDMILFNGNICTTDICEEVLTEIDKRGIIPISVDAGDSFQMGVVSVTILNPQVIPTGDENEDSIVMDVVFDSTRLLFTGDISQATEKLLIEQGGLSSTTDVLKVAHHGSADSTSQEFVQMVNPLNAVISVGPNVYGHPSEEVINRLLDAGANVFRTDLDGYVTFSFIEGEFGGVDYTLFMPIIINSNSTLSFN